MRIVNHRAFHRASNELVGGPAPDFGPEAVCRGFPDPEVFYPEAEDSPAERQRKRAFADALCGCCPLKDACREWAIENRIDCGIWGGQDMSLYANRQIVRSVRAANAARAAERAARRAA